MSEILWFLVGVWVGGFLGFGACAILSAGRDSVTPDLEMDEDHRRFLRLLRDEDDYPPTG